MSTVSRAAVVLAVVTMSAVALTACGPTGDDSAGGAGKPTASPTKSTTPAKPTAPPTSPGKKPSGGSDGSSSDPDHAVFPCSTFDVTFAANLAESTTSSYLLKITNKTAKPCKVLGHPVVTFGDLDGQATERGEAPGIEDAIRLEPGQSAYAGLMGGTNDGTGRTVHSIAMTMNTESDLEQTPLTASTPSLYVSPTRNSVTAWVNNAEDALSL
ncbi:DUF4232 domain-containing protein [Streptomyces sp. NPDC056527]|uniref:DUF4232 domain-containing protein n=1 Tax=Streptomyces sp. NPDC056527 TaxID=3345853 RepID=UPI0036C990A6